MIQITCIQFNFLKYIILVIHILCDRWRPAYKVHKLTRQNYLIDGTT